MRARETDARLHRTAPAARAWPKTATACESARLQQRCALLEEVHKVAGMRKSRLMRAPRSFTRSRNCVRKACSPVARISSMWHNAARRELAARRCGLGGLVIGDGCEIPHHFIQARMQRPRMSGRRDQQVGHALGLDHVAVHLAVDLEARDAAQDRAPVIEIVSWSFYGHAEEVALQPRGTSRRPPSGVSRVPGRCPAA